ncbi:MAG: glycosyltransferase [Muribaculaceae bacterium]|nr:glycosyltransferase [Muribaculaceae bacterium]
MKRIAVIFEGRLHEQKGVFNAVLNRVAHLRAIAPYDIDVHMIEGYDRGLNRWLHGTRRIDERPTLVTINGIDIHVHWFCHSLLDTVRHKLLHRPAKVYRQWLSRLADEMKGYDLVSAHDRIAGTTAAMASQRYGMPHYISWHGASIYTDPPRDPVYRQTTIELLEHATCNFFVSRGLERYAQQTLTDQFASEILYNGASSAFHRLDDATRLELRRQHGIGHDERVVGFAGRMESVKNVTLLPELFHFIAQASNQPLKFMALGDGPLLDEVKRLMGERGIECVMPGNVPHDEMPQWMNCMDVLVVPSRLEGFGLVAIEALQCGANVVGTDAQGLPEVIGSENAFALDEHLVENMSRRAVEMLQGGVLQTVPSLMNWKATAQRELEVYEAAIT